MIHIVRTVDAHVGGAPVRLIVDGAAPVPSRAPGARTGWSSRQADAIRKAIVLEPRGHADLVAAQMTDAATPGAHAGVVFMDAHGYLPVSGHGIIAVTTIAVERELFYSRDDADGTVRLTFETPAGPVHARARVDRRGDRLRVDSVAVTGAPAFVHAAGRTVSVAGRHLRVDVAFGGRFHAIVDTEAVGIPLSTARVPDLRRLGVEIVRALNASATIEHPVNPSGAGVGGVVFTGPAVDPEAHLRAVAVSASGAVNRAPSGTGMAAMMSVLDAMGLLGDDAPLVLEGLSGASFRGRVSARTTVGDLPAIVTEIDGSAWITGEHALFMDDDDPFREGME